MHRFVVISAILLASCGTTGRPDYIVHLVTPGGGNPTDGCNTGAIRVDVQQGTDAVLTSNGIITAGILGNLAVEIPSYGQVTQIQATITCTSDTPVHTQIGSTPHFVPTGYASVDLVVGDRSQCDTLSAPTLISARTFPHMVSLHANVLSIGGLDSTASAVADVQAIDPVSLTVPTAAAAIDSLGIGVGRGSIALLNPDSTTAFPVVIVSDLLRAIYDATPTATSPITTLATTTANSSSAVVSANGFVAIVGGTDGATPVDTILWVSALDGAVTTGHLRYPRHHAAAVRFGSDRLLVAGGQAMGQSLFEVVTVSGEGGLAFGPTDELRYAPVVTSDASHVHAWIGLGTDAPDASGAISSTAWVVTNTCDTSTCRFDASTAIPEARTDVAVVEHHVGVPGDAAADVFETLIIGGRDPSGHPSPTLEAVQIGADGIATLTSQAELTLARTAAGAVDIGGGVVLVAGGADDHDLPQQTIEICFPAALRPIGPE